MLCVALTAGVWHTLQSVYEQVEQIHCLPVVSVTEQMTHMLHRGRLLF